MVVISIMVKVRPSYLLHAIGASKRKYVFHKNVWDFFDDSEGFLLAKNESPLKYRPVGVLG
jgi:hypothetical protein